MSVKGLDVSGAAVLGASGGGDSFGTNGDEQMARFRCRVGDVCGAHDGTRKVLVRKSKSGVVNRENVHE